MQLQRWFSLVQGVSLDRWVLRGFISVVGFCLCSSRSVLGLNSVLLLQPARTGEVWSLDPPCSSPITLFLSSTLVTNVGGWGRLFVSWRDRTLLNHKNTTPHEPSGRTRVCEGSVNQDNIFRCRKIRDFYWFVSIYVIRNGSHKQRGFTKAVSTSEGPVSCVRLQ